jgi:uncharacterized membrane protein
MEPITFESIIIAGIKEKIRARNYDRAYLVEITTEMFGIPGIVEIVAGYVFGSLSVVSDRIIHPLINCQYYLTIDGLNFLDPKN